MNEAIIRQWFDIFKDNHELVEIRILDPATRKTYSGYFTDIETLLEAIKPYDRSAIYFTLNTIDYACYSREQRDRISTKVKSTTSDGEIIERKWCLVDVDCDKPSDTNSSDEEKELAKSVVNNVYKFLRDEGFESPVVCDSANGFHLLYKQAMNSTPENTETMKRFLQVLDMFFSTDKVKIDCSTFNPSRICKLYGTYSRKGSDTPERPQRCSSILKVPSEIKITQNEYFEKVASYLPEPEKKDRFNNYGASSFDLDEFIKEHDIKVAKVEDGKDYRKYVLEECPFCSAHRAPDSAVFKMRDGGFGFKCLHNSCSKYTFKDFRLHYDPNSYNKIDYKEFQAKQRRYSPNVEPFVPQEECEEKGKKWLQMSEIKKVNIEDLLCIPTGYDQLDNKIVGLFAGELTILSGANSSGKTSWLDCLALNAVHKGFKVGVWSGEMQDWRFQNWIMQIAAGKTYSKRKIGFDNLYYVPSQYTEKIASWLNDKLFLYNNNYGNNFKQIFSDIRDLVEREKVQMVIIDNLAALDIDSYDGEKYSKQTKFIIELKEYAKAKNIHIIVVCHPRKQITFLRKDSISGTADLTNIADNVFILHRVGKDFEDRASEFLGSAKALELCSFSNIIEVAKNRQFGVVDYFVGLFYEPESRRLKNSVAEHIIYGWEEVGVQSEIEYSETPSSTTLSTLSEINDTIGDFDDDLPY